MALFRFCETILLHIKLCVGNNSAICPFLGGSRFNLPKLTMRAVWSGHSTKQITKKNQNKSQFNVPRFECVWRGDNDLYVMHPCVWHEMQFLDLEACSVWILHTKARWTLSLPQTSRANPVQCYSTHQEKWNAMSEFGSVHRMHSECGSMHVCHTRWCITSRSMHHMKASTENAAYPKSAKSRNPDSSVSCGTNSNWDFGLFGFVPRNLSF